MKKDPCLATESNIFKRYCNSWLEKLTRRCEEKYIKNFATTEDGSINEALAERIRFEVRRRGVIGRMLDVYEPLEWTGISYVMSLAGAVLLRKAQNKPFDRDSMKLVLASTGTASAISLLRLGYRFHRGLEGGGDAAVAMFELTKEHHAKMANAGNEHEAHSNPGAWTKKVSVDAGTPGNRLMI